MEGARDLKAHMIIVLLILKVEVYCCVKPWVVIAGKKTKTLYLLRKQHQPSDNVQYTTFDGQIPWNETYWCYVINICSIVYDHFELYCVWVNR